MGEDLKELNKVFEESNNSGSINHSQERVNSQGQMEIETSIPPHIKEEAECLHEVEEEISRKNLKMVYQSNIFSWKYPNFILDLLNNYQKSVIQQESEVEPNSDKAQILEEGHDHNKKSLFIFVWTVYCTAILRMNNKKTQRHFFELIYQMVNQVISFFEDSLFIPF